MSTSLIRRGYHNAILRWRRLTVKVGTPTGYGGISSQSTAVVETRANLEKRAAGRDGLAVPIILFPTRNRAVRLQSAGVCPSAGAHGEGPVWSW